MEPGEVEKLLAAARAGSEEALGDLYSAYQPSLLRYFRLRAPADAEDLAAEVWLNVARGLDGLRGPATEFPRWLFTIAKRRLTDHYRRKKRRPEQLREPADEVEQSEPHVLVDDLDWALSLVSRLPAEQAEIVVLRVVARLPVDDVSAIVGKSPGAVRVASHRGLCRLRELVSRDQEWATVRNAAGSDSDGQDNG